MAKRKEHDFSDPQGFYTTSLRIPNPVGRQILERADLQKRSVNAEITLMLERQIDSQVEADRMLMEKMSKLNVAPQNNQ